MTEIKMNNEIEIFEAIKFSAEKHKEQKRKDSIGTPYINHPLGVARNISFLNSISGQEKTNIIIGALLHDTIEDTDTTFQEIEMRFSTRIAEIVQEVTNQKSLSSDESKLFELEKAKTLSLEASLIRISDKIENIKDISNNQPTSWSADKKLNYISWAKNLVNNISVEHTAINELKYLFLQRYYETLDKLKK